MMIPGAFPPHAQCDQGALPPHLTASGSGVWSWAWVTTRPLQRVSSDCPKKKMPVGGLSMQNCECVCVWLTKLSFPGGRGGQWRWWPQWCFCSVLAGLHFTLYHCCWTMVTHTHTALIFCYSHTSGPLKACVWCLTLGFELFSTSGQIHAGGNSYNHFMTLIL